MKILFICSFKASTQISPFVKAQGDALESLGLEVTYFLIKKKGFLGYLKSILELRKFLSKNDQFDIYHAHYSFSGFVASLAGCRPLVVSLLGSDVIKSRFWRNTTKMFYVFFRWKGLIVKSEQMKRFLALSNALVVANGVDIQRFHPLDKKICREKLNWNENSIIVLFNGAENNFIKNYALALEVQEKSIIDFELKQLVGFSPDEVNLCYNACDAFLSTSLWEGSPNTIKEAMACNASIVATNVGDIEKLFQLNTGNYTSSFDVTELTNKLSSLLIEKIENNGRQRIIDLQLDSISVAQQIQMIYKNALGN